MERRARRAALSAAAGLLSAVTIFVAKEASAQEPPSADVVPLKPSKQDDDVEEVSVTGTKLSEAGGSAHVVGDKQLRRFSYDNPEQVVLQVPGVYVRPEDGVGLRPNIGIRGANSDRSKKVTLMEDGVLVGPAPYSAPAAYFFPMIDRMRTVRVVKGPSSIVYGPQTVGGAIDFVSREIPAGRRGTYDLALGQYGFDKEHVTFGASDESVGFLVEGIRVHSSGFKELDDGGDTGFVRNEWMAKASWVPDPRARVQNELLLKLGYADEGSNETYLGLADADFAANPDRRYLASKMDRMDNHRTAIELTHTMRFSPKVDMTTTAYRHDFHRIWRKVNGFRGADIHDVLTTDSPRNRVYRGVLAGDVDASTDAETILIGPNDRKFVSEGLQSQVHVGAKTGPVAHLLTYGVRAHYDEIRRKHTQDGFLMRGRELVPDGRVTEVTADNYAGTYALAMWAVDAISLGPLTLTPGVRVEAIHAAYRDSLRQTSDGATYQVLIPGASAYYAVTDEVGLLGGVHEGFSPPPPEQAKTNDPEKSTNYEGGVRWTKRRPARGEAPSIVKSARAEAIGFYNDYKNITNICEACAPGVVDKQFDGGRARIGGVELYADTELGAGSDVAFPIRVSYTYTYTELLTTFTSGDPQLGSVKRGDELPYVPPQQLNGSAGVEGGRWGIDVAGTFVDSMWERAGQGDPKPGDKTDAYFLLDASARYRFFKWLELYVNGRNLLDDRYIASRRPFGARPGPPRWLIAGVRGEF
jgi:Fe(3+) dicitrate transport protein